MQGQTHFKSRGGNNQIKTGAFANLFRHHQDLMDAF